jgi:hypothetical protein
VDYESCSLSLSGNTTGILIDKKVYDNFTNCYFLSLSQSGTNPDTVRVDYNYDGIIKESYLYAENETINSLLCKLHRKEKDTLINIIRKLQIEFNKYHHSSNLEKIVACIIKLRDYYDVMDESEISEFNEMFKVITSDNKIKRI